MARPTGSVAEVHKTRRDYRFAPETMQAIADGLTIFAGRLKETAYVEQAISHYTHFLQGDPEALGSLTQELKELLEDIQRLSHEQQVSFNVAQIAAENTYDLALEMQQVRSQLQAAEQECDLTQKKNRELEEQLRRSRETGRILEKQLREAREALPKPAEKKLDLSKAYQIKIRHEPCQQCPALPQGFTYDEKEFTSVFEREQDWSKHSYCIHTVLTQHWPIARMRKEVERLKSVPGLISIWIEKNGQPVHIGGVGYNTDMWSKQEGRWIKN
ncbi:MAG TPA: hypothetical protein VFV38_24255 [Ktedonobacteraceae bacterium]|nr:hypothetical protein [Ktedonobacteraceae bacterium]